jgi:hypothetical protein
MQQMDSNICDKEKSFIKFTPRVKVLKPISMSLTKRPNKLYCSVCPWTNFNWQAKTWPSIQLYT